MNTTNHDPRRRDAIEEREWQAQERALQAERNGAGPGVDDPLVARYRVLARALRQPLVDAPPADFAAAVARQVAPLAAAEAADSVLERVLMQGLIAALGLSGGVVAMLYGRDWLASIAAALPNGAGGQWTWAIALCMGASWVLEQWRRQRAHRES
jgi:hypothetical protein